MADSVKMNYSQLSVGKEIMGSIHDETANLSSFLQQSEADLIQSLESEKVDLSDLITFASESAASISGIVDELNITTNLAVESSNKVKEYSLGNNAVRTPMQSSGELLLDNLRERIDAVYPEGLARLLATGTMATALFAEGGITFFEDIGDGVVNAAGMGLEAIGNASGNQDIKNAGIDAQDFADQELVKDSMENNKAFNDLNRVSMIDKDSEVAAGIRTSGDVAVTAAVTVATAGAGGVAAGASSASKAAKVLKVANSANKSSNVLKTANVVNKTANVTSKASDASKGSKFISGTKSVAKVLKPSDKAASVSNDYSKNRKAAQEAELENPELAAAGVTATNYVKGKVTTKATKGLSNKLSDTKAAKILNQKTKDVISSATNSATTRKVATGLSKVGAKTTATMVSKPFVSEENSESRIQNNSDVYHVDAKDEVVNTTTDVIKNAL